MEHYLDVFFDPVSTIHMVMDTILYVTCRAGYYMLWILWRLRIAPAS